MKPVLVVAALAAVMAGHAVPQAGALAQAGASSAPDEAVWHLRAGLNVAALSCRGSGREPVADAYSQLLRRHRGLLAAAYAGEQRRHGRGLDRHLTQIYNLFAYQPAPGTFCSQAAAVAAEALRMDSATLSLQARRLLGRLG